MNIITLTQFLLMVMISMAAGLPIHHRASDDANLNEADTSSRFHGRAGKLNTTTTRQHYILDLYEDVYENGFPTTDEATDVWVFVDKDIAKENFREKSFFNTECASYTQYVFQGSSVLQSLNIRNSTLRAYIQTINRHFTSDEEVSVTLTVTMVPRNENGTSNASDLRDGVIAGQEIVTVSRGSDRWIELNVTEGAKSILPMENYTDIQVIIKAEVNCNNHHERKVPFNLINPAEIQEDTREHHVDKQPFLVVFAENEETKEALRKQEEEVNAADDLSEIGHSISRRSTSSCQKSDFVVDLHELGMTNVIEPRYINISKCSGNCNERRVLNRLGTNHTIMMTKIYNQQIHSGEPVTATAPCCVPTKYETVFLLMNTLDNTAIAIQSLNYFKATECGCR